MYVDGNTGSMIVSAAVAGAAGVGVVGTAVWRKVTGPVRRAKKGGAENEPLGDLTKTDATSEQQQ